jgi:hypothetical protein
LARVVFTGKLESRYRYLFFLCFDLFFHAACVCLIWPKQYKMCLLVLLGITAVVSAFPAPILQEPIVEDHTQGYRFDPLLHLPGTSPYFDAVGFGLEHTAPVGCNVTAASYLIRHGAIYANDDEYQEYIKPFLFKLEQHRDGWQGPLEFMSQWVSPILEDHLEDLTPSGARDAFKVGGHLVKRYPDLAPTVKKIVADKKPRTFDTAVALSKAFPNNKDIEVVQFLHNTNGSLDTLTPHKSCAAFSKGTSPLYILLQVLKVVFHVSS